MSKVDVLLSKVRDCQVNSLVMFANRHRELDEFSDVPALVAGSVGVVDQYGN